MSQAADPISAYAQTRDAEAFAELVRQYQRLVFATCRRKLHDPADLDDAVQETFLKLAQKAGELKTNAGGWLHRCAVNVAIDINRRRSRQQKYESVAAKNRPEQVDDPQQLLSDLREQIDAAMEQLDDEQRELIIQRFFVGRAQVELASEAGVSPSTITHRMERAIESLRRQMKGFGGGGALAVGGAAVVSALEAEGASAAVPAALTANLMKIGLSGVSASAASAGTAVTGAASAGALVGSIAAAVVVVGGILGGSIWYAKSKAPPTVVQQVQTAPVPPPVRVQAPVAPAAPAIRMEPAPAGAAPAAAPAPQWQTTQPAAKPSILSGRILDRDGKPVAGANVTISGPAGAQVKTDADGNYSFPTVRRDGEYRIGVEAPGFVPIEPYVGNTPGLQLSAASQARRDLVMERGVPVTVSAKDIVGQPVANVRIDANIPGARGGGSRHIQTDANGIASFVLPPSQSAFVVAGVRDGYAPPHTTVTPKSPDEPIEVELLMTKGLTVSGVALCKDGKPATGWKINAYPEWWASYYVPRGFDIDAEGKFTLTDLSPGKYRVQVSIPMGDYSTGEQIATLSLPPEDGQPLRLNINRASPGSLVKLVGRVKFVGGRVDENVEVQATSKSGDQQWLHSRVETSARRGRDTPRLAADEGQFSLVNIPPGTYRLTFQSTGIETKTLEDVKVPGELPVIELKVTGKPHFTGTVTDAAGKPITHFAVRLRKVQHLGNGPGYVQDARWIQVSSPGGNFDVELVSAGVYQAQISAEGFAWQWSGDVRIEKSGDGGKVEMRLSPGGALSGQVVGPDGKPLAGAKVIPLSMAGSVATRSAGRFEGDAGHVLTDDQGRFTLPRLSAGEETLKVVHSQFAPAVAATFKVVENHTADAGVVKLSVGGTVEGTVFDSEGNPAPGVALQFQDESGYSGGGDEEAGRLASVTSDDKGFFRVEHLPHQLAHVNIAERWQRTGVVRRLVFPLDGKTTRLDFGGSTPVKGRLVQDGKPLANKRVELSTDSPHFGSVLVMGMTDQEGRFAFFGTPVGHYTLFRQAEGVRYEWSKVRELDVTGEPIDLGEVVSDLGDVVVTIEAESSEDAGSIQYVMIETDLPGRLWQENVAAAAAEPDKPGTWKAAYVPAGRYRAKTYVKESGASFIAPFERPPGSASTAVRLRIPRATATLVAKLNNGVAGEDFTGQMAILQGENGTMALLQRANPPSSGAKPVKLPAGTYRVLDPILVQPRTDIEPIVLKDGETREVEIDLNPTAHTARGAVSIRFWDSTGLPINGVAPRLIDQQGKATEPTTQSPGGNLFVAAPGHYRAVVQRPGRQEPVSKEVEVKAAPDQHKPNARWEVIDLFLD